MNLNSLSLKQDKHNVYSNDMRSQIEHYLRYGNIRNIFVFNYLDYLLWIRNNKPSFTFTSRSSIEHFYPQNKRDKDILINEKDSPDTLLHSFGNLCLISHSLNSRVTNDMPTVKVKYFLDAKQIDSLKLFKMIDYIHDTGIKWDKDTIRQHGNEMVDLLVNNLQIAEQVSS